MQIPMSRSRPATPPRQQATAKIPQAGDNPLVLPFRVLYDHRERAAGWRFQGLRGDSGDKYRPLIVPQAEIHMQTADYTIEGVPIFIERKSHDDLIGSISGGAVNFRKEHERMAELIAQGAHCCVVIESSLDRVIDELSGASARKVSPSAVMGTIASYPMRYGVPFHWAGSRSLAEELALRIMRKAWERSQAAA